MTQGAIGRRLPPNPKTAMTVATSALNAAATVRFFLASWTVVFFLLQAGASGGSALSDGPAESTALSGLTESLAPEVPSRSSIVGARTGSGPSGGSALSDGPAESTAFCESAVSLASGRQGRDTVFAKGMPLQFDSEIVRLFIEGDTLRAEGLYRFLCGPSESEFISLFYPYPDDSLLGEASTVSLECRTTGGCRQPLDFVELPDNIGARWKVPLTLGDTLEVRTVYSQSLLGSYARYIVTTARGWPRPLRYARFEIFLPDDAEPVSFSLPFKPTESTGRNYYLYEVWDFSPGCDIVVEWAPGPGGSAER